MSFIEEVFEEIEEYGTAEIENVPSTEKGTSKDWIELEDRISLYVRENEVIMAESELNAALSALC